MATDALFGNILAAVFRLAYQNIYVIAKFTAS